MGYPDRLLYPETRFTKADAIDYYRRIAKVLLPHLKRRPLSFKRYVDNVRGESFWEKDAPSFTPEWVKRVAVPRRSDDSEIEYVVVDDVKTLTWVADVGGIELHPFLHRLPDLERPTHVVFDLDPGPGTTLAHCCEVAVILRDALEALALRSFAKVSGSKGLQVYVPLNTPATHTQTEPFAQVVAQELARAHPKLIVAKMQKNLRMKKVFIDWSQNADYKTTVAVYSLRAKREEPLVSMPVTWEEVEAADVAALEFSPSDALARVARVGDLFAPVLKVKQKLPGAKASGSRAARPSRPLAPARGDSNARVGAKAVRGAKADRGVNAVRDRNALPKPKSQSGRRLFVLPKTEMGNELWIDMRGKFKRWILRPDTRGGGALIALPAGEFAIDPAYYRGEVPAAWRGRVAIDDIGTYEVIEGSYARRRFRLWFTGKVLTGEWNLEKISAEPQHRSWSFAPS